MDDKDWHRESTCICARASQIWNCALVPGFIDFRARYELAQRLSLIDLIFHTTIRHCRLHDKESVMAEHWLMVLISMSLSYCHANRLCDLGVSANCYAWNKEDSPQQITKIHNSKQNVFWPVIYLTEWQYQTLCLRYGIDVSFRKIHQLILRWIDWWWYIQYHAFQQCIDLLYRATMLLCICLGFRYEFHNTIKSVSVSNPIRYCQHQVCNDL